MPNNQKQCKKCYNKINLPDTGDECYKCRRKWSEEVLRIAKINLEETKRQLKEAMELRSPHLIKDVEEVKKTTEAGLEKAEFLYLCSLLLDEVNLEIFEENYRTVKNHPLYTIHKKSVYEENRFNNNRETLDYHYSSGKDFFRSVANQNNNYPINGYQCSGCGKNQNHSSLCDNCKQKERERESILALINLVTEKKILAQSAEEMMFE